jgi:diguanylate cyclase (GGDEF)-like protein
MKDPVQHDRVRHSTYSLSFYVPVFVVSTGAMLFCFAISLCATDIGSKVRGFLAVLITYSLASVLLFRWHARDGSRDLTESDVKRNAADDHLKVLDETLEFFAGSLSTSDTFRLVASRVAELVGPSGISLLVLDREGDHFVVVETNCGMYQNGETIAVENSIVGPCLAERDVFVDKVANTATIPLKRDADIFGLLVLKFTDRDRTAFLDVSLLDAIGERSAPLFLASIAYANSQQNALTDPATDLPNERAFHLVLENQVAETIRKGISRPLTILSFDILEHEVIVSRFGHASGDRILNFVAQSVKENLRQMDFFARGRNDEFLAIMPTASKEIAHEIIARIQTSLFGRRFKVSDVDAVEVELSFGWASFGGDGERPDDLIAVARERKDQAKTSETGSVVWFPRNMHVKP